MLQGHETEIDVYYESQYQIELAGASLLDFGSAKRTGTCMFMPLCWEFGPTLTWLTNRACTLHVLPGLVPGVLSSIRIDDEFDAGFRSLELEVSSQSSWVFKIGLNVLPYRMPGLFGDDFSDSEFT